MGVRADVVVEEGMDSPLDELEISRVIGEVLVAEGIERPCLVSVSIVSDRRMRELNASWRGIDAPTDVLSLECERPDDPDLADGEPCELGDIVLASAYVAAQADRFGTSPYAEMTLLLIHGTLHLLGYDHLDEAEAKVMEGREDELLAHALGTTTTHVVTTRHREGDEGERP